MSIITTDSASWIGGTLIDRTDQKLGTIEEIYADEQTGQPLWMVVRSGRFGARRSFVPLTDAMPRGDAVTTPYKRSEILDAPKVDLAEELPDDQVRELYDHYGLAYEAAGAEPWETATETPAARVMSYLMCGSW